MSVPTSREAVYALLPALAVGRLPADEADQLLAIVHRSPELQAELASLRVTAAAMGMAVPASPQADGSPHALRVQRLTHVAGSAVIPEANEAPRPPTDTATRRTPAVMEVEFSGASRRTQAVTPLPSRTGELYVVPGSKAPYVRRESRAPLLVAIGTVAALLLVAERLREVTAERDGLRQAAITATARVAQLERSAAAGESLVTALTDEGLDVVDLKPPQRGPAGARLFWDRSANRWTLVTHDLEPASNGRTYQVWLVTADARPISACTFNTDSSGRAVVRARVPAPVQSVAQVAITEEPAGGSTQPTGPVLAVGSPTP